MGKLVRVFKDLKKAVLACFKVPSTEEQGNPERRSHIADNAPEIQTQFLTNKNAELYSFTNRIAV
jgi:hypothetical protein